MNQNKNIEENNPVGDFFQGFLMNARFAGEVTFRLPTILRQAKNKETFLHKFDKQGKKISGKMYGGMLAISMGIVPLAIVGDITYTGYQALNKNYIPLLAQLGVITLTNSSSGIYEIGKYLKNRHKTSKLESKF